MEHVCVDSRFYFWDGKTGYTVEFVYGLMKWFLFEGRKDRDALFSKKIDPKISKSPTRDLAEEILYEYLQN